METTTSTHEIKNSAPHTETMPLASTAPKSKTTHRNSTPSPIPLTTFHLFPRLPVEIRCNIWRLTITPHRIHWSMSDDWPLLPLSSSLPTLFTSHESRREVLPHYTPVSRSPIVEGGIEMITYINYDIDILCLPRGLHELSSFLDFRKPICERIRWIEVDPLERMRWAHSLQRLYELPALEMVIIKAVSDHSVSREHVERWKDSNPLFRYHVLPSRSRPSKHIVKGEEKDSSSSSSSREKELQMQMHVEMEMEKPQGTHLPKTWTETIPHAILDLSSALGITPQASPPNPNPNRYTANLNHYAGNRYTPNPNPTPYTNRTKLVILFPPPIARLEGEWQGVLDDMRAAARLKLSKELGEEVWELLRQDRYLGEAAKERVSREGWYVRQVLPVGWSMAGGE